MIDEISTYFVQNVAFKNALVAKSQTWNSLAI